MMIKSPTVKMNSID